MRGNRRWRAFRRNQPMLHNGADVFSAFSHQLQHSGNPFRHAEKEGIKILMLGKGLAAKKKSYLCGLLAFFGIGGY